MSILVYGDLHLYKWTEFATTTEEGVNSRLQDGVLALRKIRMLARKHSVDAVVSNGDFFHKRIVMDVQTYNAGHTEIALTANVADEYFNPGNHDQSDNAGTVTSVSTFASIPRVRVVKNDPIVFEIKRKTVMMIPYMMNIEDVRHAFRDARKVDIVFYHGGINGAVSGTIEYRPREELELVDMPKNPLVLCSHYHKRQQIRSNVWYIGAPMQHNRGDRNDTKRGCLILGDDLSLHWINFKFPQFITHYDNDDAVNLEGNFVDVLYDPLKRDLDTLRESYAKFNMRGVKYIPHVSQTLGKTYAGGGAPILDYDHLVERHVERSETKLNKARLRRIAQRWLSHD